MKQPRSTPPFARPGSRAVPLLLAACLVGQASAIVYTFDDLTAFEPLSGVPAWTQSEPNSSAISPLAYVSPWTRSSGPTLGGAIGGLFDVPAAGSFEAVYNAPLPVLNIDPDGPKLATVSLDLAIIDSTNAFPGRDSFGFSVKDGVGGSFFTAIFDPLLQSATPADPADAQALWRVSYTFRGGSTMTTLLALAESAEYTMEVSFLSGGLRFAFDTAGSASLANEFFGTPVDYDPVNETIAGVGFDWLLTPGNPDFGNNYLLFDNIVIVPEPGPAGLAVAAFALALFTRRRATPTRG